MLTIVIVMIVIGIVGVFVLLLKYTYGDAFKACGRKVYVDPYV